MEGHTDIHTPTPGAAFPAGARALRENFSCALLPPRTPGSPEPRDSATNVASPPGRRERAETPRPPATLTAAAPPSGLHPALPPGALGRAALPLGPAAAEEEPLLRKGEVRADCGYEAGSPVGALRRCCESG